MNEEKHPTQHEEQIKKHFEFPEDLIPRTKWKQSDIPEMKISDDEQQILNELLLKLGYSDLSKELMKLLLKQKTAHRLTWDQIKKLHALDRRSLIKIKNKSQ